MATKKTTTKASAAKAVDFKTQTREELAKTIASLRLEVVELKRGTKVGDVQNVRAYSVKRRELARALTALNSKTAEGEEK